MPGFEGLAEYSPWWWVALAILLAAIEMVTVSTVLIWSALAALVTAIVLWLLPAFALGGQVALFAVLSVFFTLAGRHLAMRYARTETGETLNRRAEQLVGREGIVEEFAFHEGKVTVDGIPWPARIDGGDRKLKPGDRVRVIAADGIVIWVKPL